VVGGVGTLLDMGLYAGLRNLGVWHWPALALSFGTGVAVGFYLTRRWVFDQKGSGWQRHFVRFIAVILVMYFVNGLVIEGIYKLLPLRMGRNIIARGLAAVGTFPLSFYLHRRISFS
jgi:putative flippase GtrA